MDIVDNILNKNIPSLSASSEPPFYGCPSFEYGCLGDPFEASDEAHLPSELLAAVEADDELSLCPPPTFEFSPAVSGNNNYCREAVECFGEASTSTLQQDSCEKHFEEEDDADFNSSVLNCLPTSCDELEIKEMKLKLERVGSSPLTSARVSPGSGRSTGASSRHSMRGSPVMQCDPVPPDEDDLEVQMINESFEEQQKQSQLYETGELKSLFYHCNSQEKKYSTASDTESEKSRRREEATPSHQRERMPYAVAMSAQASLDKEPERTTPEFIPNPLTEFEPVLTPKSEAAMIQSRIAARISHDKETQRRRVSEPLAVRGRPPPPNVMPVPKDSPVEVPRPLFLRCSNDPTKRSSFNSVEQLLKGQQDESPAAERPRSSPAPSGRQEEERNDETEALAMDVIESLFAGQQLSPAGPSLPPTPLASTERPSYPISTLVTSVAKKEPSEAGKTVRKKLNFSLGCDDMVEENSEKPPMPEVKKMEEKSKEEPEKGKPDVLDSWEDFDDDFQPTFQLPVAPAPKPKPPAPSIDYLAGPVWDSKKLPHVLEATVPTGKRSDDVREALVEIGFGEAEVFPVDSLHYLCIFASAGQALDAQILHRHQWLRFKPLHEATTLSQRTADMQESRLQPRKPRPKQSGQAARRMVENALGIRSTVSREQRAAERRELDEARAAKKQSASIWGD